MTVNHIGNYSYSEQAQKTKQTKKSGNQLIWEQFINADEARESEEASVKGRDAYLRANGPASSYAVYNEQAVFDEKIDKRAAVHSGSVRSVSYGECDYVKVCAQDGYILKAKVDADRQFAYVEQKFENGMVKAFEVDLRMVDKQTDDLIEQTALKALSRTQEDGLLKNKFEQALAEYSDYVEERIKEGPEKFQIGGSEMTLDEWDKLMQKIDDCLDEIKESMQKDIEVRDMKAEAEKLRELKEYQYKIGDLESYQYSERLYGLMKNEQLLADGTLQFICDLVGVDSAQLMPSRLQSGIVGMSVIGAGDEAVMVSAHYADNSTIDNPIIEISLRSLENNETNVYQVNIKEIDPKDATQMEMFALCAYADAAGLTGALRSGESYMNVLHQMSDENAAFWASDTASKFTNDKKDWTKLLEEGQQLTQQKRIDSLLTDRLNGVSGAPYSYLADASGIVEYNGVTFVCDYEHNALCLGDVSNPDDVLVIPLSKGGCLKVNRNNIGDLAKAITMFSPADINLIMRAIAQDAKVQQMKNEIDDLVNSVGEHAEKDLRGEFEWLDIDRQGLDWLEKNQQGNLDWLVKEEV